MDFWTAAASYDRTLTLPAKGTTSLRKKQVLPEPFSLQAVFDGMAGGEPRLLHGLPVERPQPAAGATAASIIKALDSPACRKVEVSIRSGKSGRKQTVRVPELMRRWRSKRASMCVTDFHIRGTPIERAIDVDALSHFNLLCQGTDGMAEQEMMTMVVSSRGWVTDSHSDDPDGSNHCFTGSKLWLVWDTFEGRRRGLQDVERDDVLDRARFDMATFLSLKSSRWFVVAAGQTLFLPGHLTHKVITLEPYLGVGSFYVSIPNCVRTIGRWIEHGPLWSLADPKGENARLVADITEAALAQMKAAGASNGEARNRAGLAHLPASIAQWKRETAAKVRTRVQLDPLFRSLLSQAEQRLN